MTYDEFFRIVKDTYCTKHSYINHKNHKEVWFQWIYDGNQDEYKIKHTIGGASGGSCWDDENSPGAQRFTNDEPIPEIDLHELFEVICPEITYLQHRKIMNDLVKVHKESEWEYYGNYTDYVIKSFKYRDLYDALVKEGIISSD